MMETQWHLGSRVTAAPPQWDSRTIDSLAGQAVWSPVPCGTMSLTWVWAQGRLQREGTHGDTVHGVESSGLEGHGLLLGACMTAGSRMAPRSEASLPKEMGKTGSAPWRKQCKTKWLWMEQLTGNIFHLWLHVEVISPNELKLLENCKSNGK